MIGSIIDDIGLVVSKLRTVQDGPPYYMPGHPAEIMQRLGKKTQAAKEKYPLIFLKLDFLEPISGGMYNYDLNLGIMMFTKQTYTLQQRRDNVFTPILIPLYESFMKGIRNAGKFSWGGEQTFAPHTPVLRPFWGVAVAGNNTKNIFGDPLDCIEIINLRINKRVTNCK
jgi:hypothetical protein